MSRVAEVDRDDNLKESLQTGVYDAVSIENYSKAPMIGKVPEIHDDKFKIQYWKGSWRRKWQPWLLRDGNVWEDELPIACLLQVDFKFDSGGKLQLTYKYLKETYERLAKNV